ncbi:MAG: hydantoinase/oxoprolinase family protein [Acidimicrobiales bacterium]
MAVDDARGRTYTTKTPSTPLDPSVALHAGISKVLRMAGRTPSEVTMVVHGTTTATNAVLEHEFEGIGLLVTRGFRHILEIARQSVPDGYGNSFFWVKPPRLVPLHLVEEVTGRMDYCGDEIEALDEHSVREALSGLRDRGVDRVGVCLLHSYACSDHERRVGEIAEEHFPDLSISLSSTVLPEYREYERAMTTLLDVMVKPYCSRYLKEAERRIGSDGGGRSFLIMQSNGGVVSARRAAERPITMLMSGPAAGVLGAIHAAGLSGIRDILTFDVGGTSTDVCVVRRGVPVLSSETVIEGYPVKVPIIDMATVGTGGGSIAWVDSYGSLKVGPRSAGADPGPISYGRGGTEPTVTDAALVLGRLPTALIGGELTLRHGAAQDALGELGSRLRLEPEEAAAGVLEIAAVNQVHGIRRVTVQKGIDPSTYCLVAFGGAGGMLATDVAGFLGSRTILSPSNPGNLSALGLQVSDIRRDLVRTFVRPESTVEPGEIAEAWWELEASGYRELRSEGVDDDDMLMTLAADLRYRGQSYEVRVPMGERTAGESSTALWGLFHEAHDREFGYSYRGEQEVELVNLRLQAIGRIARPTIDVEQDPVTLGLLDGNRQARKVYWRKVGWVECSVVERRMLRSGSTIEGPTIVEEYGSTLVIPARWHAVCDDAYNLLLERD